MPRLLAGAGQAGRRRGPRGARRARRRRVSRRPAGGAGLHVYVRISPRWGFGDLRRAALAFAREIERRVPDDATTVWWRKDRDPAKVFVDFNQNARDHTIASRVLGARASRPARVSTPFTWDELDDDRAGPSSRSRRCRRGSRSWATCTPRSTTTASTSRRCWNGPTGMASRRPPNREPQARPRNQEHHRCSAGRRQQTPNPGDGHDDRTLAMSCGRPVRCPP